MSDRNYTLFGFAFIIAVLIFGAAYPHLQVWG